MTKEIDLACVVKEMAREFLWMIYYGSPDIFAPVSLSLMSQIIYLALSVRTFPIGVPLTLVMMYFIGISYVLMLY